MGKKRILPYEQGHFDGLCGIYAIINALFLILQRWPIKQKNRRKMALTRRTAEKLYAILIRELLSAPPLIADNFVFGVSPRDLRHLLRKCDEWLTENYQLRLRVRRPFYNAKGLSKSAFMSYVNHLNTESGTAIILGGFDPWSHWSVVERVTNRGILLFDSSGYRLVSWKAWPKGKSPYFALLDRRAIMEISLSG